MYRLILPDIFEVELNKCLLYVMLWKATQHLIDPFWESVTFLPQYSKPVSYTSQGSTNMHGIMSRITVTPILECEMTRSKSFSQQRDEHIQ